MTRQEVSFTEFEAGDLVPRDIEKMDPPWLQNFLSFGTDVIVKKTTDSVTIYPKTVLHEGECMMNLCPAYDISHLRTVMHGAPTVIINTPVFRLN